MKMLERIEKLLDETGLTQAELERLAGLAENRISRWKGGLGEPTARQAVRIARALGVRVEWLVDDDATGDARKADGPSLTADDWLVLQFFRKSRLPAGVVTEAIMNAVRGSAPAALPAPAPAPAPEVIPGLGRTALNAERKRVRQRGSEPARPKGKKSNRA